MESSSNHRQSEKHPNHPRPDPLKPRAPRKETYAKHAPKDVLPRKYQRSSGTCQKGEYPCPVIGCKAPVFTRKYALVEHMGRNNGHANDILEEDIDQTTFRLVGPKLAGQLETGPSIIWNLIQPQCPPQAQAARSSTAVGPAATGNILGNNGYVKQKGNAFDDSAQSVLADAQAYPAKRRRHGSSSDFDIDNMPPFHPAKRRRHTSSSDFHMDNMPPSYPSQLSFPGDNSFSGGHNFPSGNGILVDKGYYGDNDSRVTRNSQGT